MAYLDRYKAKRDFTKTKEPPARKGKADGDIFVVQKHSARRLHYDFRLALDGVLKSWAVTRGPSLVPGEKRLAVHVEDHPYDYATFEGVIPEGQYGAGPVIVWDRGRWIPEGDPRKGYKNGRLNFRLEGEKLKGAWHLVRMHKREGERQDPWLLIKADDEAAKPARAKDILKDAKSVISGRSIEEVEKGERPDPGKTKPKGKAKPKARSKAAGRAVPLRAGRRATRKKQARPRGKKPGGDPLPDFVPPCLATLVDEPPKGQGWIHEIKFDGYRTEARLEAGEVKFLTRSGLDWTEKFDSLSDSVGALDVESALLDGEIVVESEEGRSDFSALQDALTEGGEGALIYYVFDLLHRDGVDLRKLPLRERKAQLKDILAGLPDNGQLRYSQDFDEPGALMLEHACRLNLEGIVSKRSDAPYSSGRGKDWLKSKCSGRQEFIIVGYSPSTVAKNSIGAIAVAYYEGDDLVYAGRVGTGFSQRTAAELGRALLPLEGKRPRFRNEAEMEAQPKTHWVKPKLVAEIEFRDWTGSGILRHAVFKGLREDKKAEEIVKETPRRTGKTAPAGKSTPKSARPSTKRAAGKADDDKRFSMLTHPDKLLWKDAGVTKLQLAEFYSRIWKWIGPYLIDRPLALVRCPDGADRDCFFQKHSWAGLDDKLVHRKKSRGEEILSIDRLEGLIALVQAGVLEIHPWGTTIGDMDRADRLTFDLDPGEDVPWKDVVSAARLVKKKLEASGLVAFLKTTGGKGLHVVTPLAPPAPWDDAKSFAHQVALDMEEESPDRFIATSSKRDRAGKIFIDYLRNSRGATAVAAYSTRARAGATVSTPLFWEELNARLHSDRFTVENIEKRLSGLKSDPWKTFGKSGRPLPTGEATPRKKKTARAR